MASDDSLLREVDDDLRHDRMVALWRQYRLPLLVACVLVILGTAGGNYWRQYQDKRAGVAMVAMQSAQTLYTKGKFDEAAGGFAAASDKALKGNARDMAHLWQARALEKAGKTDEAVKLLATLADHPQGNDTVWADLACLRLAGLDETRAKCLTNGPSSLKAERDLTEAARQWTQGHVQAAHAILRRVAKDPKANEALRSRAKLYMAVTTNENPELH